MLSTQQSSRVKQVVFSAGSKTAEFKTQKYIKSPNTLKLFGRNRELGRGPDSAGLVPGRPSRLSVGLNHGLMYLVHVVSEQDGSSAPSR